MGNRVNNKIVKNMGVNTKNKRQVGLFEISLSGSLATVHLKKITGSPELIATKELDPNNVYPAFNKFCEDAQLYWEMKYEDKLHG
tara:strand:+ start:67 stop:321 length:255 start_codon:yes stop_codon:yes gene_type:complete